MEWIEALRGSVVGLDTAPLIYFIEENPRAARDVLDEMMRNNPHQGSRVLAAKTLGAFGLK